MLKHDSKLNKVWKRFKESGDATEMTELLEKRLAKAATNKKDWRTVI